MPDPSMLHYHVLGLQRDASDQDVRSAYLRAARTTHPDKTKAASHGDFAAIQEAYHVLSDPALRRAYDGLAREVRLRQHQGQAAAAPRSHHRGGMGAGEEAAVLLGELAARGLQCDALTQLVVTCEVCRRPATLSCWVCSAAICSFCVRTQHQKVSAFYGGRVARELGRAGDESTHPRYCCRVPGRCTGPL